MKQLVALLIVGLVALSGVAGAQPEGGDPQRGERVYRGECAMCHGSDAAGMMGMHPSLRGAVERLSREGVEVTIRKGRNTMPPMPAFEGRLTDQAIADVMAYLESLPAGPRNFGPEGGGGMGGMMGGADSRGGDRSMTGWFLAALVVLVLALVVLVALAARQRRLAGAGGMEPDSVLDRRYAAGEVSREEYLDRRRDLER